MKKLGLILYLILSGTLITVAQIDSLEAWEAGKNLADATAHATGYANNPFYVAISAVAPVVFAFVWRITHLKKKHKKEIEALTK